MGVAAAVLGAALTETIEDLLKNATVCGCCSNNENHSELIKRALERTPVDWWPYADVLPAEVCDDDAHYVPIRDALVQRKVMW